MKKLILITIVTWAFGGGYQYSPYHEVVGSKEDAAIKIFYNQRAASFSVEPDQKEYHLYEVDLESMTIKEIPIPELTLKEVKDGTKND